MVLTQSAVSRVERVSDRDLDDRVLRIELLRVLRETVPFEDHAWLLTDPVTTVGSAPLADVRCLPELPRLIGLRYRTTVNRWTTLGTADSLLRATRGQPSESLVWRDLLQHHGVGDVATMVFRDGLGLWGWVDLWRSTGAEPFSAAEIEVLAEVSAPITTALRRGQARHFAESAPLAAPDGLAVLMLSEGLDVVGQTPHTGEYLRLLVPPAAGQSPIPAGAFNVAAQLLAVEAGIDDHPPSSRVHLGGGRWVTLRADRIGAHRPGAATIAVTIELTSPADRLDVFTRAFGLSRRESELVGLVVDGHDSADIAARMFLSPHTVQDHLKSVFAKTSTRSRRALVSLVRGR